MKKIRKAILPVAGLGTRFLPATKTVPKEMLTIVDKPVIQYVVEEAMEAGIEHFIFVTGRNKSVIEDYFDTQFELYKVLEDRNKDELLEFMQNLQPQAGTTMFTRQQDPLGLGHALWCARDMLCDEPFALLLPDMIMQSEPGCLKKMVNYYNALAQNCNIISVELCEAQQAQKYGIVAQGAQCKDGFEITTMIEKPVPGTQPSNLFINGRYILQPEIFSILENQKPGVGGEIQLTDAMLELLKCQKFYGYIFEGKSFDCGSKLGFLEANIAMSLNRAELKNDVKMIIEKYCKK